jgi:hypothetical protein
MSCTATTNRFCYPCSTCTDGTYEITACTSTVNRVCYPCSTCAAGTYETTSCTATSNRVCSACTLSCGTGTYETTACTATSNRVCTPYKTTCPANQYLRLSDNTCIACPAGTVKSTTGTSQSECVIPGCASFTCPIGKVVLGTCTNANNDGRYCFACPANSGPNENKTACKCNTGYIKAYSLSTNDLAGLVCDALPPHSHINSYGGVECDAGYIMGSTGCVAPLTSCPPGQYLYPGFNFCYLCDIGTYKNDSGIGACTPCPDGWTNGYRGSTNCPIASAPAFDPTFFGLISSTPPEDVPVSTLERGD